MNSLTSSKSSKGVSFESHVEQIIYLPPDGGWGWIIVIVSFFLIFMTEGTVNIFGMFFEDIGNSFDVEASEVAIVSSIMNGMYLITSPLTCGLINHYGFRVVTLLGSSLGTIAFFVSTYLKNITSFVIIMGFFGGIGFNMIFTSSLIIVGFYFEKWRVLTTSIALTGGCVGSIILPLLFNHLLEKLMWTDKFKIMSCLCFGMTLLSLLYKPLKPVKVLETERNGVIERQIIGEMNTGNPRDKWYVFKICQSRPPESNITEIFHESQSPSVIITRSESQSQMNLKEDRTETTETSTENLPDTKAKKCCWCVYSWNEWTGIHRDDLFYTGSIYALPEYKDQSAKHGSQFSMSLGYHITVSRTKASLNIPEEQTFCEHFRTSVVAIMKEMVHYKIMKSPSFLVLTLSGFFTMVGYYLPYIFIIERGKEIGLSIQWCTLLLTILGVFSTLGTIVCGIFSFFPKWNIFTFSYVTLFFAGGIMIISSFSHTLLGQAVLAVIYGFSVTSFVALRTNLIAYLVGLQSLTNAVGINFLFFGVGNFIGIFLSVHLSKVTGTYKYIFRFGGISIFLSGLLLVPVEKIAKWEQDRTR